MNSLRTRIGFILIALAVVPLLLVGGLLTWRIYDVQENQSIDLEREVAQRVGTLAYTFIRERNNELGLVIRVRGLQTASPTEQNQVLANLLSQESVYTRLILLDKAGDLQAYQSRYGIALGTDLESLIASDLFQVPLSSSETYYSPVQIDPATGEPLMTIGIPIVDLRSGQPSQVLIADFRFKTIWDEIAALEMRDNETVYIVDNKGRIVAHRNPSIVLANTHFIVPPNDGNQKGLEGDDVILAMSTIEFGQQQFTIVAERLASRAMQLARDTLLIIAVALLTAIGATIIIGVGAVNWIVRPILNLVSTARAIRDGNLSERAEVKHQDEIGTLAEAFNSMTAQLQETLRGLETRVQERTRDLQIAADVSRQITTVLDINTLLDQVCLLTSQSFDFYATFVFLVDEGGQSLVNAAGANPTGNLPDRSMIPKIATNQEPSLVALAAREKRAVVVNDVTQSQAYLGVDPFTHTRSEMALPIMLGKKLLGVFDLQANTLNRFGEEDIRVLTSLAEQIAIAVRNAQLYTEAQDARTEAELANQVKSQFLAAMSHELRTPLNSIINFTGFVVRGIDGTTVSEKQAAMLNRVIASGNHLLSLINDVLDISKIESGALELFIEERVDVDQILKDVVITGENILGTKPVQISLNIEDALPPLVADERRIRQIILNIVSNACKFTDQGTITINARCQNSNELLITIQDTGSGIAPEEHSLVFDSFKQTKAGLVHGGGTGLGMPISKRLAEAHGGRLWLESTLGQGTTFFVALPIRSEALVKMYQERKPS